MRYLGCIKKIENLSPMPATTRRQASLRVPNRQRKFILNTAVTTA